jgi:nucleoid-associated protein YgaU
MADATAPETPAAPAAAGSAASPASPAAPAAAAATVTATGEAAAPAAPKVKHKKATQRACDEKDAKGKLCCGHLKRWYDYPKDVEALVGKKEVYRCEFCKTLYTPDLSQAPHSYTLRY